MQALEITVSFVNITTEKKKNEWPYKNPAMKIAQMAIFFFPDIWSRKMTNIGTRKR